MHEKEIDLNRRSSSPSESLYDSLSQVRREGVSSAQRHKTESPDSETPSRYRHSSFGLGSSPPGGKKADRTQNPFRPPSPGLDRLQGRARWDPLSARRCGAIDCDGGGDDDLRA